MKKSSSSSLPTVKHNHLSKSMKDLQKFHDIEADLDIARKIQAAMIPQRLPIVEGLDMSSLYLPCKAIGGDLFDVLHVSDDLLVFVIFDVAGHGVASALLSAMAKVSFANHIRAVTSPRAAMERVNAEMIQNISADYYLTAFVAYLDLHNSKLTYCNGGHSNPLVYRARDRELVPLASSGTFIGVFENGLYEEKSIFLSPGDWLVLFTDGIYGIFGVENELQGQGRLERELLKQLGRQSPQGMMDKFKSRYSRYVKKFGQDDDITILAVEMLTQSRKNQMKQRLGFAFDDPVYLQVISYFEEMDKVTAVILSSMDAFGYSDDCIRKMKIALTELLANAIYHGNKKDHTKKVMIGHLIDKVKIIISILDEGDGFDPAAVPDPTLPENLIKGRGRGLYIVHNYVDEIRYNDTGSLVTITKFHGAS
ncbi:MAG: SpoIIE family protein phosphatase [Chitinivibrionales bacterium]|nr:SpoIIE family protein phosphatase [Chitinivibrionales bacterium]